MKHLIIVCDGAADYPVEKLSGKTPLMAARIPLMDKLAKQGKCGRFIKIPEDLPAGSEVANLSIMGYDPKENFCQRGILEAASLGVDVASTELAMRCNLIYEKDGILMSHSGGDYSHKDADEIINLLNDKLADNYVKFHTGTHYRHLLVLKNGNPNIKCWPPHDYIDKNTNELLIEALEPEAKFTADTLNELIQLSRKVLQDYIPNKNLASVGKKHGNLIWPWAPGVKPNMKPIKELTGLSGASITAVDLIKGLSIYAGMDVINVEGATGNYKTNYEGKAEAAIKALSKYDYIYLHIEAADEAGHDGDLELKIKVLEDINNRLLNPILKSIEEQKMPIKLALLPDHPTPVIQRYHVKDPVPVVLWGNNIEPDEVSEYNEKSVEKGSLGTMDQAKFFDTFFKEPEKK